MNQNIENLRLELSSKIFDQGFHWRILFIGTSVNGTTDIVSSLSRSLRNLGHHVLDLDTRRHPDVLENPQGVSGGMGPIFVRYSAIETLIDRFRPQMVIACAGGLTFSEEDAQAIKDRGIALVGMTLSDPDVFPTVHGHNHVFDLHTTNAEISLDMYREAGVENTVYFPFGIDRGFVTQEIAYDPQFEADVICLGHANNRPDRNAMMTALARRFDVRTYGRGWEIPNSETVAGEQMVQALKAGRIHVNFPLTRAGFVNIKCGVFESAGQGAVVATGRFKEMERFFTYGEDIIGYEDEADLARQIDGLLANPAEYDRIAENGFRRIVNEHLYEHRWMTLFSTLADLTPENSPWLAPERRERLRATLSASLPRAKKIIVAGFYGANNLGDELILRSVSEALSAHDPAVQVVVASENPGNVERSHGLQSYRRTHHKASAYEVRTAAAVVVGGGGLWHDYTFERGGGLLSLFNGGTISMAGFGILPLMGRVLDKPYHVVGLGVGPLDDPAARQTVKYLANQTETLYVRDPESAAILKSLPVEPDRITVGPDVVYGVGLPDGGALPAPVAALTEGGRQLVALNLRPWAGDDMDRVVGEAARALNELARERPIAVVGVPMQAGATFDATTIQAVVDQLDESVPAHVLEAPLSLEEVAAVYRHSSALVAMRLHACLLAHRLGLPAVGLCYDPKVARHFDEVGRRDFGLDLGADAASIGAALHSALEGGLPQGTRDAVGRLEAEARQALAVSARAIAGTPVSDAVYTVPPEDVSPVVRRQTMADLAGGRFIGMNATSTGVGLPERAKGYLYDLPIALHLSLDTDQPKKGMAVRFDGALELPDDGPRELVFRLLNNYANPKAAGRVFVEFQVGDQVFRQDIAESKDPVLIHMHTRGQQLLPVGLRLVVDSKAFKADSWRRASRVMLRLLETRPSEHVVRPVMYASAGSVSRIGH